MLVIGTQYSVKAFIIERLGLWRVSYVHLRVVILSLRRRIFSLEASLRVLLFEVTSPFLMLENVGVLILFLREIVEEKILCSYH